MTGAIFISYRRGESLVEARAVYERLSRDFRGRVFIDLEGIDFGDDFVETLQRQLAGCQVMLALIGPGWLGAAQGDGRRAIDDEKDFVHIELATAFAHGVRVVPVLLNGAALPDGGDLPPSLQPLLRRQAMVLDFRRFDSDAGRLAGALRRLLKGGTSAPGRRRRFGLIWGAAASGVVGAAFLAVAWFGRVPEPRPPSAAASAPSSAPVASFAVGTRFRDCASEQCPWLRVIGPGRYAMGSAASEPGHTDNEGPVRTVTLPRKLAVGETEVTRRQFASFQRATNHVPATGCYHWSRGKDVFDGQRNWRDPGFAQTDDHPVVCVSWLDAQAYTRWLSAHTGKSYRLLSEAEWEYAARAGSSTRYSFGDRTQDLCVFANVLDLTAKAQYAQVEDTWQSADCTDGAVYTVPVARFKPNAFNLYGMHGNVWEWVQDCWHDDYAGAPAGPVAWEQDCVNERRVRRGGGWRTQPQVARSAFRGRNDPGVRLDVLGFRVARDLAP